VSILFKPDHTLFPACARIVQDRQLYISFMSRAELLLWPRRNNWGMERERLLRRHMDLCLTLYPDDRTCLHWRDIMAHGKAVGRGMSISDAWIAATAKQWNLPLVTADASDFNHVEGLTIVPVGA
jgi:tRNA(fMet)-specific endonuclease VapC